MNFKKIGVGVFLTLLITTIGYTADKKISELNSLGQASWASNDLFPIVDTSATETKNTSVADFDARFFKKSSDMLVPQYGGTGQNFSSATGLIKASSGTFSAASLVDADVSNSANLTLSKLASLTANRAVITNGSGVLAASGATASQLLDTLNGATAVGVELHVDISRTDSYTADGSVARPFKTFMAAVTQIILNGDNSSSKPYTIRVHGPAILTENIVLENLLLTDLYVMGDSALQAIEVNPASGDSLRSIANNSNLHILGFTNFVFDKPVELIGDTDNSHFLEATAQFFGCYFNDTLTVTNAGTMDIIEGQNSGDIVAHNVLGFFVYGGQGLTGNSTITFNSGDPKPGGSTATAFILTDVINTGDTTLGANTTMQARGGSRIGSPGGSLDVSGTLILYPSYVRSNITVQSGGTIIERGGSYDPTTLTLVGGSTQTRDIDLTSYTSSNTASTIVKRDSSGNFSAGTITAALSGNAATATTAAGLSTVLDMAHGGSNANLTASNGAVAYSSASALALSAVGTSGQVLKSAGAGAPSFADISLTNMVYVSKNGNDSTCAAGAITRPCLTIAGAYAKTTSLSNTNRYVVKIAPGVYDEGTTLAMKGNVFLVGDNGGGVGAAGQAVTVKTANGLSLATGGSSGIISSASLGLYNVAITGTGGTAINMTFAGGASSRTLVLKNVFVADAISVTSTGTGDYVQIVDSNVSGPTLTGIGPEFSGVSFGSDITISKGQGLIQNSYIPGNLVVQAPTGSSSVVVFASSLAGIDLQDAAIDLFIDSVSIPAGGVTNTGGGTYHFTTSAFSINYLPTTSANWTTALTAVQDTLDLVATGSFSTQGYQLNTSGTQPTCDVTQRGRMWNVEGGAGVADVLQVCQKTALDTYAWAVH